MQLSEALDVAKEADGMGVMVEQVRMGSVADRSSYGVIIRKMDGNVVEVTAPDQLNEDLLKTDPAWAEQQLEQIKLQEEQIKQQREQLQKAIKAGAEERLKQAKEEVARLEKTTETEEA